ncbi:kinase-like protein [Dothidotthia symphoricarpi CBS 119687]|uniref:Kinase-like protein n=1 Tax=Dothidotthia symphoricarpi CBS 119687 TaxID=1392245 RepID=A0A6A6ATQ2_9PLEO|nr:kinase-like protein [Dothidotthia symphoricarpi CBS 119687]KAF2134966.1 kinase-like protein [Dothidotthia symphoricarpi CBS 119687]
MHVQQKLLASYQGGNYMDTALSERSYDVHDVSPRLEQFSSSSDNWHPVEDSILLHAPPRHSPGSLDEASSVDRNGGLSIETSENARTISLEQAQDLLAHTGAQFPEEQISAPTKVTLDNPTNPRRAILDNWIRERMVLCAEKKELRFLPINEIQDLVTQENIRKELQQANVQGDLSTITADICEPRETPGGKSSSRQRIFAVLCMLQKASEIVSFIRENIFDSDLPFIFDLHSVPRRDVCCTSDQGFKPVRLFSSEIWRPMERELFYHYQGQLLAPLFRFSYDAGQKVMHFPLKDEVVLPFIEDTLTDGDVLGKTLQREGGFSFVRKVKIHPAHYTANPKTQAKKDLYFAVKELKVTETAESAQEKPDHRETLALKRVNEKRHKHLIRLLATYTHNGRFHMIFPWADGNLKDLWKTSIPRSPELAKWLPAQILGLARGLQHVHYCTLDKSIVQDLSIKDQQKIHGRHGDLKPENILWFQVDDSIEGEGSTDVLKIADFGFADFHGPDSKSNVGMSAIGGFTDTYKAPELDVRRPVSAQYDIWSFGCILLQFAVWSILGWDGVEGFSKKRTADSEGGQIPTDKFFKHETVGKCSTARAKVSVVEEFGILMNHVDCSDYIVDLLKFIESSMLRVHARNRADIDIIVQKFEELEKRCNENERYCTHKTQSIKTIGSDLSEIVEIVESREISKGKTDGPVTCLVQTSGQPEGNELSSKPNDDTRVGGEANYVSTSRSSPLQFVDSIDYLNPNQPANMPIGTRFEPDKYPTSQPPQHNAEDKGKSTNYHYLTPVDNPPESSNDSRVLPRENILDSQTMAASRTKPGDETSRPQSHHSQQESNVPNQAALRQLKVPSRRRMFVEWLSKMLCIPQS